MATPFSFSGSLNLPGGPGLPNDPIPISMSSSFDNEASFRFVLTGSGTKSVNLGTIGSPGIKGLLIEVEASATAAPVIVKLNGSATGGAEVSAGGFYAFGSPLPVSGIIQLDLVYTTAVNVRVWALS